MNSRLLPVVLFLVSSSAWAGRPVFEDLDLTHLVEQSDAAVAAWPLPHKAESPCGPSAEMWQVNYVIKGDSALRHKPIPVYPHGHHVYAQAAAEGKPGPSYRALRYVSAGAIDDEHKSRLIFLKKEGECWEFSAAGAQEVLAKEALVRSLVNPLDCRAQLEAVRVVLYKQLPTDCAADGDCKVLNLHPNACERPRALNGKAATMLPPEWAGISSRARAACASKWKNESVCVPTGTAAYCKGGRCQIGVNPPAAPEFREASMGESCAPSDGPSAYLVFSNGGSTAYPRLTVNWWGLTRPLRKPGDYSHSGEGEISGSYCVDDKNCAMLSKLHVNVHLKDDSGGDAELEGSTHDGAPIKIKAPLKLLLPQKTFCG
ncbi:MAG: hypothetical protein ACXVCS_17115 [Bdellovibrionota bacterium]